jgi:hypothetical protein
MHIRQPIKLKQTKLRCLRTRAFGGGQTWRTHDSHTAVEAPTKKPIQNDMTFGGSGEGKQNGMGRGRRFLQRNGQPNNEKGGGKTETARARCCHRASYDRGHIPGTRRVVDLDIVAPTSPFAKFPGAVAALAIFAPDAPHRTHARLAVAHRVRRRTTAEQACARCRPRPSTRRARSRSGNSARGRFQRRARSPSWPSSCATAGTGSARDPLALPGYNTRVPRRSWTFATPARRIASWPLARSTDRRGPRATVHRPRTCGRGRISGAGDSHPVR